MPTYPFGYYILLSSMKTTCSVSGKFGGNDIWMDKDFSERKFGE